MASQRKFIILLKSKSRHFAFCYVKSHNGIFKMKSCRKLPFFETFGFEFLKKIVALCNQIN